MRKPVSRSRKNPITYSDIFRIINEDADKTANEKEVEQIAQKAETNPEQAATELNATLSDDELDELCYKLSFMVKSTDEKVKKLFEIFKAGWKEKYHAIQVQTDQDVEIGNLKPTQNVIWSEKSLNPLLNGEWKIDGQDAVDAILKENAVVAMGDPIIVCKVGDDSYLIDGHHRWSKVYAFNPNAKMKANIITNAFSSAAEVLKFAQGAIAAAEKKDVISDQPKQTNMYDLDESGLATIIKDNLKPEILEKIKNAPVTKDVVTDEKSLCTYLYKNIEKMRSDSPAGKQNRDFMPQFPKGDSNPKNELNRIKTDPKLADIAKKTFKLEAPKDDNSSEKKEDDSKEDNSSEGDKEQKKVAENMRRVFRIRNYKGNLNGSITHFQNKKRGFKVVEAVEDENGLKITAQETEISKIWEQITALCLKTKESLAVFEQIVELTEKAMEMEGDDPHSYQASNTLANLRAEKKAIEQMKAAFGDIMAY